MANYISMSAGQANKEALFNDAMFNLSPANIFGINQNNTAGLSLCLFGGKLASNIKFDDLIYLTLVANSTNYVEANPVTKTVTVNQSGFTATGTIHLWKFITNANSITNLNTADERAQTLYTADSSIQQASNTTSGIVKTSTTVFSNENSQLDIAIDDVTIKKNSEGKLYSVGGGGGGGDGGSGLTFLEEDKSILSNAILLKPNSSNTESSISVGFINKGNGCFVVTYESMPGNARGNNSVDIQPHRTAVTQVSNGIYAVSVGNLLTTAKYCANLGYNNTVTNGTTSGTSGGSVIGQNSTSTQLSVALGSSCTASSANGSIAIGDNATASGAYSIANGFNVSATATGAVAMGRYSISNGQYVLVFGEGANAHSQNGGLVIGNKYSSTATSTEGTAQLRLNCYYAALQSSTLSRALTANGNATASFANQFSLNNYQRRFFRIFVQMSEDKATGAESCWEITGYIKRDNGASTTTLLSSTITPIYSSELATNNGYSVSIDANTSLGCLRITCNANAVTSSAHTIKCNATTIDNQLIVSA